MKLPDVNVLLNAVNRGSEEHDSAREWLVTAFQAQRGVGLAWIALIGFIRLSTKRGILEKPLNLDDAFSAVDHWIADPAARILHPSARHGSILRRLLVGAGSAGNLTTDAHLAALAIEHGATVGSFDRDFKRFAGLDFELIQA